MTMRESSDQEKTEANNAINRPDPAFKLQTRLVAEHLGLQSIEAEFPQTLRADLILAVPESVSVEGTLFGFFRSLNVLEFKSQEDKFDEYEFVKTEVRTALLFLHKAEANAPANFEDILNVIVCSRFPQRFFDYMREQNCPFQAEKTTPWLWRSKVGLQEVAVVVCRDLPLEPPYYNWLIFAPADSRKWRNFVIRLAQEQKLNLLDIVHNLRPKEFKAMSVQIKELLAEYTPEERRRYVADWLDAFTEMALPDILQEMPDEFAKALARFGPQFLLKILTPEQRQELLLENLTEEQRQELLRRLSEQATPESKED